MTVDEAPLGEPFQCVDRTALDTMAMLPGPLLVCANDPPWSSFRDAVASASGAGITVVAAWDMDLQHLEHVAASVEVTPGSAPTVVGFGGGTALDTAKFVAWKRGLQLVQIPTITSVDAAFTDAVGVRDAGRVRYVGRIAPVEVVLDIDLICTAPPRLNRAGVGDVLSCHTGLFDWRLAAAAGHGPAWDHALAKLGETLLVELEAAAEAVAANDPAGVRFLADAYRRIGAACAHAGHSRFEEGSEHFWAYAYEHATGAHLVHGEVVAFAVCALAHIQGNDPERARRIVIRSGVRAHPEDLGISESDFRSCALGLAEYSRAAGLDIAFADLHQITPGAVDDAWRFVCDLPRRNAS